MLNPSVSKIQDFMHLPLMVELQCPQELTKLTEDVDRKRIFTTVLQDALVE